MSIFAPRVFLPRAAAAIRISGPSLTGMNRAYIAGLSGLATSLASQLPGQNAQIKLSVNDITDFPAVQRALISSGFNQLFINGLMTPERIQDAFRIGFGLKPPVDCKTWEDFGVERTAEGLLKIYDYSKITLTRSIFQAQDSRAELNIQFQEVLATLNSSLTPKQVAVFFGQVLHEVNNFMSVFGYLGMIPEKLAGITESHLKFISTVQEHQQALSRFLNLVNRELKKGSFKFNPQMDRQGNNEDYYLLKALAESAKTITTGGPAFEIFLEPGQRGEIESIKRILLLDDDQGPREMNTATLKQSGCQVTAVATPEEAISSGLQGRTAFDAIFLDLDLGHPELNGFDVYEKIRADFLINPEKTVPMILCSARHADRAVAQRARELGFAATLFKTFSDKLAMSLFQLIIQKWNEKPAP